MAHPTSSERGTCQLCGGTYTKRGTSRHLGACLPEHLDQLQKKSRMSMVRRGYHLAVDGGGSFCLHLLVAGDASLRDLDQYLRDIWLECCGHLSAFTIDGEYYSVSPMTGFGMQEQGMTHRVGQVLEQGATFEHQYDFGSTTYLELRVVGTYDLAALKAKVQLLARNEMPEVVCEICQQGPANSVCGVCSWEGTGFVCDECAPEHECGEEMLLPFVNSPRTGVCGYTG